MERKSWYRSALTIKKSTKTTEYILFGRAKDVYKAVDKEMKTE